MKLFSHTISTRYILETTVTVWSKIIRRADHSRTSQLCVSTAIPIGRKYQGTHETSSEPPQTTPTLPHLRHVELEEKITLDPLNQSTTTLTPTSC